MSFFVRTVSEVEDPDKLWLCRGKLVKSSNAQPYSHPSAARLAIEQMVEKHVKLGEPPLDYVYMPAKDSPPSEWIEVRGKVEKAEPNIVGVDSAVRIIRFEGQWEVVRVLSRNSSLLKAQQAAETA